MVVEQSHEYASRNRLHPAKLLESGGNLVLIDEPTNDLDVDALRTLEEALIRCRRLRRDHQPRPLVPRPQRHARTDLGGAFQRAPCAARGMGEPGV